MRGPFASTMWLLAPWMGCAGIGWKAEAEVGTQTSQGFPRTKGFTLTLSRALSGAKAESACVRASESQLTRLISHSNCLN